MTGKTLQVVCHTLLCSLILMIQSWCLSDYFLVHHRAQSTVGETIVQIFAIFTQPEQLWDYHTAPPPPPPQTRSWWTWVCHRSSPQPGDQEGYHMSAPPLPLSCGSQGHSFYSVYNLPVSRQLINQMKGFFILFNLTCYLFLHKTKQKVLERSIFCDLRQTNRLIFVNIKMTICVNNKGREINHR